MSLNGGLRRPLHEAVKLNPGISWRIQDVGNVRVMRFLMNKATNREWNQPKRNKCVAVNKTKRSWRSEECFDIRHGGAEFRVSQPGFLSCFGPVFPMFPFLCFGMVPLYAGNI